MLAKYAEVSSWLKGSVYKKMRSRHVQQSDLSTLQLPDLIIITDQAGSRTELRRTKLCRTHCKNKVIHRVIAALIKLIVSKKLIV